MPYPLGTKVGAPLTNGDPAAKFGTHIDYLGVGGFRSVPTIAERDAIPVKPVVEYDGGGSGMRREGMLVYCQDTKKTYQLSIPNYNNLPDDVKLIQLADNTNFFEVQFGTVLNGETILDIYLDGTDLIIETNVGTRKVDFSTLGDVHKDYVDDADAALQAQITENAININTIVTGAPSALDTLKEIADQIATDEAGVAAILATQQQHTQQLATVVKSVNTVTPDVNGNVTIDAGGMIDVTYAQLTALIAGNGLKKGNNYVITDYQTIQPITGTSAYSENGVTIPTFTARNPALNGVERLIVFATSENKISANAKSVDFPNDEIVYDVTVNTVKGFAVPGIIKYRRDAVRNIETYYDYRKIKMRRYKVSGYKTVAYTYSGDTLSFTDNTFNPAVSSTTMCYFTAGATPNFSKIAVTKNGVTTSYQLNVTVNNLWNNDYFALVFNHRTSKFYYYALINTSGFQDSIGKYAAISASITIGGITMLGDVNDYRDLLTFDGLYEDFSNITIKRNNYRGGPSYNANNIVISTDSVARVVLAGNDSTFCSTDFYDINYSGFYNFFSFGYDELVVIAGGNDMLNFGGCYGTNIEYLYNIINFEGISGTKVNSITNVTLLGNVDEVVADTITSSYFYNYGDIEYSSLSNTKFTTISNASIFAPIKDSTFVKTLTSSITGYINNVIISDTLQDVVSTTVANKTILFLANGKSFYSTYDATGKPTYTSLDGTVTYTPTAGTTPDVNKAYVDAADANLQSQITANTGFIGVLSTLTTTAKNTLVAAINELKAALTIVTAGVNKLSGVSNNATGYGTTVLGGEYNIVGTNAYTSVIIGGDDNTLNASVGVIGASQLSRNDYSNNVAMFGFYGVSIPAGIPAGIVAPNLTLYNTQQKYWDGNVNYTTSSYKKIGFNDAGAITINGLNAAMRFRGGYEYPTIYQAGDVIKVSGVYYIQPVQYNSKSTFTVADWETMNGVVHRSTTTVTFERDAEYDPIYSGTFTVDDTNKVVGAVVCVYLGPSASAPTIPTTGYQSKDTFTAGKNLMYMFKVGANGNIQYTITILD